jgi:hypothetical protein
LISFVFRTEEKGNRKKGAGESDSARQQIDAGDVSVLVDRVDDAGDLIGFCHGDAILAPTGVSSLERPKTNGRNEQSERDGLEDSFQGEAGASISNDTSKAKRNRLDCKRALRNPESMGV